MARLGTITWRTGSATATSGFRARTWTIHTLEGYLEARLGDWIVKGVAGEFYPVRPDIFAASYEPVCPLYSLSESGEIKRVE